MSYISREISLFCQKPFFWYFLFAALVDARVHSLGFAIPLAFRQKEVTMLKSRLHFGGQSTCKDTQARSSCLHMLRVCWVIPDPCCMSVGLSLIPSSLQHCLGSLVWLHHRYFPSAWLCLFHDPIENTLPHTHFFMYKGLKFVCILLTNYQLLCCPFKKTSRRKETPSSELWKKHDFWFRAKWSHYS